MEKTLRLLTGYKTKPQWVVNGGADNQSVALLDELNNDIKLNELLTVIGGINDKLYAEDGSYRGFQSEEDRRALRDALSNASGIARRIAGITYEVKDESVLP